MDNIFYWLSKAFWALCSPDSFLVILGLFSTALLLSNRIQWAKRGFAFLTFLMLLIAVFPLGQWLLIPLESRFPANPALPDKIDGIIVLSGPEEALLTRYWQQPMLGGAAERNLAFMALARQYPKAKLVFTGGGVHDDPELTQAYVAKQLFRQQQMDVSRIHFENKARNTAENASLSVQLIKPEPSQNWLLITSAFHMPRSVGLFCQQRWKVIPYPVDFRTLPEDFQWISWKFSRNLQTLNIAVKEWIGLSAYYAWGKTPSWFPKHCA